jgi:hypothetical protein
MPSKRSKTRPRPPARKAARPRPAARPTRRPAKSSASKSPAKSAPVRRPPPKTPPAKTAKPAPPPPEPATELEVPLPGGRRHVLSLAFVRDGDEFLARLETDSGHITELKNRSLDQLLTLVAGELEDLLE